MIGTKGRDLATWAMALFFVINMLSLRMPALNKIVIVPYVLSVVWFFCTIISCKKNRIKLEYIRLIPIWPRWARFLTGSKIQGNFNRAYEVHIEYQKNKTIRENRDGVEKELVYIYSNMPGLYIWETATNVPGKIKKIIKDKEPYHKASWGKGVFIKRPPFIYKHKFKKPLRCGAVLVERNDCK